MATEDQLYSEKLADFIAGYPRGFIPEKVLREGRRHILDTLGVILGARRTDAAGILLRMTREFDGMPQVGVLGESIRTSVPGAARLLGTMSHILDFDDTHIPTVLHPSGPALAAVLPLAELRRADGADLLDAFTFGVEAGCRAALALGSAHREAGWHVTGTAGPVTAAAASARLLRLDKAATHNALSIAATEAAGHHAQAGTMTKPLHSGNAAANGVTAALLAEKGFVASRGGFEGPSGLLSTASTSPAAEELAAGLGETWETLRVGIKPYPCGVVMHPGIDAVRGLARATGAPAGAVERLTLEVNPLVVQLTDKRNPRTGLEGKFSITFAAAINWIEGAPRYGQFTDEKVNRPDVRALSDRVDVVADPDLAQTETKATVYLRGGGEAGEHVRHATGTPENPISDKELQQKFSGLVVPELGERAARRLLDRVEGLGGDNSEALYAELPRPG